MAEFAHSAILSSVISSTLDNVLEQMACAASFAEAGERLIAWARELTGCQAGMVRLREDDPHTEEWIPAVVESGYGCRFLRDEVLIGANECMCGRVARGCPSEDFPFFTPGGSFLWGKVQSIASDFPVESLGNVRGTCITEGFESVAIIPIMMDGSPVGCLHLADSGDDKFGPYVGELEEVCRECGPMLLRFSREEREASVIGAVESALTPTELPEVDGLELAVSYTSATSAAHLGGDFYDVFELEDGDTLLVVGDYCGKGLGAAGMAARARHVIEKTATGAESLEAFLAEADKTLGETLPQDKFVTIVACRYSPDGRLKAAVAGHPFPALLQSEGSVQEIDVPTNVPLGVAREKDFDVGEGELSSAQTLLLYTDGIVESRREGRFFGLEGIEEVWREELGCAPGELTASLCRASARFGDEALPGDDRLALAARVVCPRQGS